MIKTYYSLKAKIKSAFQVAIFQPSSTLFNKLIYTISIFVMGGGSALAESDATAKPPAPKEASISELGEKAITNIKNTDITDLESVSNSLFHNEALNFLILDASKKVMFFIAIIYLGLVLVKKINTFVKNRLEDSKFKTSVFKPALLSITRFFSLAILLTIALSELGINMTTIIALLSTIGLAVGLALQGTLQNLASGLMLLVLQPIKKNEYFFITDSYDGILLGIDLFYCTVEQADGKVIFIPNSKVFGSTISNCSRRKLLRCEHYFDLDPGTNFEHLKNNLDTIINDDAGIAKDPSHTTYITLQNSTRMRIQLRYWVKNEDYWDYYLGGVTKFSISLKETNHSFAKEFFFK